MDEVNRRPMDMNRQMSIQMAYKIPNQMLMINQDQMSNQMLKQMSNMRNVYGDAQPNQYLLKDSFGNYAYGYSDMNSEKREEGNDQSVKGTYTYIMSNGMKRRVDYIADDQGFHILRDDADSSRIKRSVEPDLINTRMTSFMDSSSLRDDGRDMYRMGQDMSPMNSMNMGMNQQRYSNMMDRDMMGRNMDRNMMDRDMMGRNMDRNMMDRNMMGRNMDRNMMDRDMMSRNMMDRNMMRNGMMGRRNIYNINQDSGVMRQQMSSNMLGRDMSSNMMYNNNMMGDMNMGSDMMTRMNAYTTEGMMGQQLMSQKMEMERIPETYTSTRFF